MQDKIMRLYPTHTNAEICNMLSISIHELLHEVKILIEQGKLEPKTNRMGMKYKPRLTEGRKEEILNAYFVHDRKKLQVIADFNLHKTTFDRLVRAAIRSGRYKAKKRGRKVSKMEI